MGIVRVTAAAVLLILPGRVGWAQDPVVGHVGAVVRVTAPSVGLRKMVGTLAGANDSFVRLSSNTGTTVIPRDAIEKLQWSRGLHRPVLRRALEFGVVGAAFGLLVASTSNDPNEKEPVCSSRGRCAAVVGGGAAVLGVIAGAVAPPQHDWEDIPDVRRVRVSVAPLPRGAAALLTVSW